MTTKVAPNSHGPCRAELRDCDLWGGCGVDVWLIVTGARDKDARLNEETLDYVLILTMYMST